VRRDTLTEDTLPLAPLIPFDATARTAWAIPFGFDDYLELVDWTGRAVHPNKKGAIPETQPKILKRLAIRPEQFIRHASRMMKAFGPAVGSPAAMTALCEKRQTCYLWGMRMARVLFGQGRAAA